MSDQIKIDFENTIKTNNFSSEDIESKKHFLNKFIEKGFPNKKLENWKFLDLSQIIKNNIGEINFDNDYNFTNKFDTSKLISDLEHNKIIFVNGRIEKLDFSKEDKSEIEIYDDVKINDKSDGKNSLILIINL